MYQDLLKDETRKMTKKVDELSKEVLSALTDMIGACPLSTEFPYRTRVEYTGSRKYGQFGMVVGFRPDRVKVLFEESQNIVAVLPKLLQIKT